MNTVLDPLLLPDQLQLSASDRRSAASRCSNRSSACGGVSLPRRTALSSLDAARTRGELRQVFDGVADALPPRGLTTALRAVSAVWLVTCVVQFVIWVILAVFGHFDWPWWLWSDIGLGMVVAILWWTNESYHRKTDVLVAQ